MRQATLGILCSIGLAGSMLLSACGSSGGGAANSSSSAAGSSTTATSGAAGGTTSSTATASGGSGSGTNCTPGTPIKADGGFTMVCLKYNDAVFGATGAACGGVGTTPPCGFDQGGNTLDAGDPVWPKQNAETKASGVNFWFPTTGGNAKLVNDGLNVGPELGTQTVPVPQASYSTLELLAGAGNSNSSQMLDIEFDYTDGTSDKGIQQNIDDWCNTTPVGQAGFTPADRWSNAGASTTPGCGVFVYSIAIPGKTKKLKQVVFSDDSGNAGSFEPEIVALSLKS